MGLGQFAAGAEPAGLDPVAAPSTPPSLGSPPKALEFDLTKRQWIQNADGSMKSIDPVDARVIIALGFALGKIATAPAVGNELKSGIQVIDPNRLPSQVEDKVHAVLDPMVTAGDISLDNIETFPLTSGYIARVTYTNLRTKQQKPITV